MKDGNRKNRFNILFLTVFYYFIYFRFRGFILYRGNLINNSTHNDSEILRVDDLELEE